MSYIKVTDKEYSMDRFLKSYLDKMVNRSTKQKFDNLLVIDGEEGTGKSTFAIQTAYYYAYQTGRKFDHNNVFFNVENMMEFATQNDKQVIVWDEAALGGLSDEHHSKVQRNLIKMVMVARKKQHFFVFNIPKFFKLREYLIVDRSICLIHTYARNHTQLGYFQYFTKGKKEKLYYQFKSNKTRQYWKYYAFAGCFPNVLGDLINEEEYEKNKDQVIMAMCQDEGSSREKNITNRHKFLKQKIGRLYKEKYFNKEFLASKLGVQYKKICEWAKIGAPSVDRLGDVDSSTTFKKENEPYESNTIDTNTEYEGW